MVRCFFINRDCESRGEWPSDGSSSRAKSCCLHPVGMPMAAGAHAPHLELKRQEKSRDKPLARDAYAALMRRAFPVSVRSGIDKRPNTYF